MEQKGSVKCNSLSAVSSLKFPKGIMLNLSHKFPRWMNTPGRLSVPKGSYTYICLSRYLFSISLSLHIASASL